MYKVILPSVLEISPPPPSRWSYLILLEQEVQVILETSDC